MGIAGTIANVLQKRTATSPPVSTGVAAGIPGTWAPGGSTPPNDAADANTWQLNIVPTTAWTIGQYAQGATAGAAGEMYWNGSTWVAGRAP